MTSPGDELDGVLDWHSRFRGYPRREVRGKTEEDTTRKVTRHLRQVWIGVRRYRLDLACGHVLTVEAKAFDGMIEGAKLHAPCLVCGPPELQTPKKRRR